VLRADDRPRSSRRPRGAGRRSLRRLIAGAALVASAGIAGASTGIERRVLDHVDRALADGVAPEDFHHLALVFHWRDTLPDPRLAERAIDRLAASPRLDPLMADELRAMRARLASEAGRPAAARELFAGMGGLTRWWAAGPVGIDELDDFDDLARLPVAADWRSAAGTDPLGWVRLSGLAWPAQRQMLTLATTVVSEREQPVAIRVGAAQAVRVWLNGREVLTSPRPIERADDQTTGGGWLRRGPNLVVAAVASESDDWWLRVRLTAPDGAALSGVGEAAGPPEAVPPVDRAVPEVRDVEGEIRRAVRAGRREAEVALAAYLVLRRPQAVGAGEARSVCRSARAAAPGDARLLEWLMTTDDAIAYELLRDAVAADPELALARIELAAWFGDRGLFDDAAAVLEPLGEEPAARAMALDLDSELWGVVLLPELVDLARRHPTCEAVGRVAAHRAMDAHRIDLARELVAPLRGSAPGAASVVELRQRLAEACNDGDALLEVFAEGLEDDPNNTPLRLRLVRLVAGVGDAGAARERLVEGLDRSPSDVDLLIELARVEHAAGDDGRALELSRRVLELRPQDRRASRLVELISGEVEDLSWLRGVDELRALAAAAPPGDPAVTLLDHVEIHFLPSQLIEEKVQQVFLVTAAARAEAFRRRTLPYVAESERLRVLRARVIRQDGSEEAARQGDTPRLAEPEYNLYYDTRLRVLDLPELADGDLIEVAYVRTETIESNETGPYDGGLLSIGRSVPTVLAEIALVGPAETMPAWELFNLEGEPEQTDLPSGQRRLAWSWRDLEPAPHDVPPAPPFARGRYLAFSSHPDWGELASWYARHVAPRVRGSRQIAELAERLTEGVDDRLERIARVYAWVTNEVDYVGLEFGEHRFRPFSADWVLTHGIGDCKDKAALLVALYEAIDIPARMVMVRTADLGPVVGSLALLEVFNHAIAYLPEDDLWLDGTAAGHALLPPPAIDQGATVLVVEGPGSRPRVTPVIGAGRSAMTVTLGPAGEAGVPLSLRLEDTGEAADRRRSRFAGSKDPRPFAAWLQGSFPGAELTAEPVRRLVPSSDPAIVELEAVVARAALIGRGGVATYPGELELASRVVPTGERSGPLLVELRPDIEWTLEVDLGRPPGDLPEPVTMTGEFGSLRLDIERLDTGYRVTGYFHLAPGLVPADRAAELRAFLLEVERLLARPLEAP
jgi:transglutaminase-like putative cysteine protease/thioredoxin-like negative regulator of GroEL